MAAGFDQCFDSSCELNRPLEFRETGLRLRCNLFSELPRRAVFCKAAPFAEWRFALRSDSATEFEKASPVKVFSLEFAFHLLRSTWFFDELHKDFGRTTPRCECLAKDCRRWTFTNVKEVGRAFRTAVTGSKLRHGNGCAGQFKQSLGPQMLDVRVRIPPSSFDVVL